MNGLIVSSTAFENAGLIPVEHTGHGSDRSPELILSHLNMKASSIAVVMNDLDHPISGYNHWVIWNIGVMPVIPEKIPHGEMVNIQGTAAVQGIGYGKHQYRGPKPPFHRSHRYEFCVYVLDTCLNLPGRSRKKHVLQAMQGHILQQGVLQGYYQKQREI